MADWWTVSGLVGQVVGCVADVVAGYGENEEWQTRDVMTLKIELPRGSRARVDIVRANECCLLDGLLENSYLAAFTFVAQIALSGPQASLN